MRRKMMVGCLAAALAAQVIEARGQAQADARDVPALVAMAAQESDAYVRAFNKRNTKGLAALFTGDADFAFLEGPSVDKLDYGLVRGRDLIVTCHDTFFSLYPDSTLKQTVTHVRLIRPDVMITDFEFEVSGMPGQAGPIRGRAVAVRVLESGVWKIAAERNVSRNSDAK